jgi:hypothetical protein
VRAKDRGLPRTAPRRDTARGDVEPEIGLALGGILLGWLLGVGQQIWRERREAMLAGRILSMELASNLAAIEVPMKDRDWDAGRMQQLSQKAWEAHGLVALRILDLREAQLLTLAYNAVPHVNSMLRQMAALAAAREPEEGAKRQSDPSYVGDDDAWAIRRLEPFLAEIEAGYEIVSTVAFDPTTPFRPKWTRRRNGSRTLAGPKPL